jgi:hypothetical protein
MILPSRLHRVRGLVSRPDIERALQEPDDRRIPEHPTVMEIPVRGLLAGYAKRQVVFDDIHVKELEA